MDREPPELVALRSALGAQLAAARRVAEVGQQQVGRKTGYSRSSVAHAEAGRQLLTREFWQTVDELLQADGALLAGYERVHAAKQDYERRRREAELAEAYAAARTLRATTTTDLIQDADGVAVAAGSQAAATIAASPLGGLDIDEQERLTRAIASPSRVDAQVIGHIEAILQHCKRLEDTLGPQAVLRIVLGQRQLVHSLLTDCPAPLRPRLLSVHSNMSSSAGFYFFDLDDVNSAMRYCDQARAAAHEAHNTELAVYALCNMSYFASWHGETHAGLDFVAAAQSLVGKTDDVLLRVCVAERAGTAYAVDGQHRECMTEFERAQAGLESSDGQVSPESPAYWYHEGLIASQHSDCLLRLGRLQEAAAKASVGLQVFDNSFVGSLAFCTLRLGTAHLQSGEISEAARVIGDGALLATQSRSARLAKEVRTARAQMQPWRGTRAVQALDQQLVGIGLGV
ncbi:MAG: helix-turn-helix domain-containing protein [Pseudonocardiales bacterium]|nr:helix-turn-helix domain-containing protein [Pseudonocardiales bacterium]